MVARYGEVAAWAREAGYDGVQLGSANAKLLDQFLSPFYNRRTDEFGGSLERRARVLRLIRDAVAERAGADFPCTVKVPVGDARRRASRARPTRDALRLAPLVEEWGFDAVTPVEVSVFPDTTLSRGGVPDSFWTNHGDGDPAAGRARRRAAGARSSRPARGRGRPRTPFAPVWNRDALHGGASSAVGIPVFAVGGIRTARRGPRRSSTPARPTSSASAGRSTPSPTSPRASSPATTGPALCRSSNRCVPAQMLGMKGVCYNPEVRRRAPFTEPDRRPPVAVAGPRHRRPAGRGRARSHPHRGPEAARFRWAAPTTGGHGMGHGTRRMGRTGRRLLLGGLAAMTVVAGTAIPATAAFATDDYPVPPSPTVEVEGTTVTPSGEQASNNGVEVLGAQVTRGSMPFTGGDVAGLAAIGVGAVAVGAVLVQRSRSPWRRPDPARRPVRQEPGSASAISSMRAITSVVEARQHVERAEVLVHLLDAARAR